MAITAKVASSTGTKAVLQDGQDIRVLERTISEGGSRSRLTGLTDVDASTLSDGSVLIYDEVAGNFKTTTTIEAPNTGTILVNGGVF
jgi:hypothetical protein